MCSRSRHMFVLLKVIFNIPNLLFNCERTSIFARYKTIKNVTSAMSVLPAGGMSPETVYVKKEREWADADDATGLYAEHDFKHELVLGPERLQPQDIAYALHVPESLSRACPETVKQEPAEAAGAEMSPGGSPPPDMSYSEQATLGTCFVKPERGLVDKQLRPSETFFKIIVQKSDLMTHICINKADKPTSNSLKSDGILEQSREKLLSCDTCGKRFEAKCELIRHFHSKINLCSGEVLRSSRAKLHVAPTGGKRFTCDVCKKQFSHSSTLSSHRVVHTGEKRFSCEVCKKLFSSSSALSSHRVVHAEEKRYACDVCKKQFSRRDTLFRHRLTHTEEKRYTCDVCKKQFSQKCYLATHRVIHTEKPYTCDVCKKQFSYKSYLTQHMLVHSGEKPYTCDVCMKQFSDRSTLAKHRSIHSGDKRYTCDVCKKQFSQKSSLDRHRLVHIGEKPYTCDVCKKQFSYKPLLSRHKLIHTGEKPYTCDVCKKHFSQKFSLARHRLIHTGAGKLEESLEHVVLSPGV